MYILIIKHDYVNDTQLTKSVFSLINKLFGTHQKLVSTDYRRMLIMELTFSLFIKLTL